MNPVIPEKEGIYTNWTIDEPDFICGWVSPDGHTFSCNGNGHEKLARYLLEHIVNGRHTRKAKKKLLRLGWVIVYVGADVFALQPMTRAQECRLIDSSAG